jgi:hypothetical protein
MIKKKFTISNKGDYNATFFSKNKIIFDIQCAVFLGVDIKLINEIVINNPEKFPEGYIINFSLEEWEIIREKVLQTNAFITENSKSTAFTLKGFLALVNILKSKEATSISETVIDVFTKLLILSQTITSINETPDSMKQNLLIKQSQEFNNELLFYCLELTSKKCFPTKLTTIRYHL